MPASTYRHWRVIMRESSVSIMEGRTRPAVPLEEEIGGTTGSESAV